jgi:hypothetical protein
MKFQLLVGEVLALLQESASQDLLGGHALTAVMGSGRADEVAQDDHQDLRIGVEDLGDLVQFPADLAASHHVEEAALGMKFSAHPRPRLGWNEQSFQAVEVAIVITSPPKMKSNVPSIAK